MIKKKIVDCIVFKSCEIYLSSVVSVKYYDVMYIKLQSHNSLNIR